MLSYIDKISNENNLFVQLRRIRLIFFGMMRGTQRNLASYKFQSIVDKEKLILQTFPSR
jgi:hypothetical protein